jgi:hypothetical protein
MPRDREETLQEVAVVTECIQEVAADQTGAKVEMEVLKIHHFVEVISAMVDLEV